MAFSTNFSANMAPTTYIIYRGEPFDASAPLNFFPAKDSDELFDALRAKYPALKTHSERMREAVIDFLMEEQAAESFSNTTSPTMPSLYDDSTASTSPNWQQSWPSMSSTTQSTPEMLNMATPNFINSPRFPEAPQFASMSRQASNATESADTTPALDQMTSVFALSTSEQPKQRIRRKMTEAEKVEYRKRRIVKACEKCSKRKRKCNHNQPEMETLPATAGKAGSRVTKPRNAPTKAAQHARNELPSFGSFETDGMSLGNDMQSFATAEGFEDFDFLLNDSMPEVDLDEMLQHFDQPATQHNGQSLRPQHSQTRAGDHANWSLLSTPDSGNTDDMAGLMFPGHDFAFDGPLFTGNDEQQTLEHYRTHSAQPTHTAHLHGAGSSFGSAEGTFGVGKAVSSTLSSGRGATLQAVPLAQAVLRLNGTTKAVRAFENAITGHNPTRFSRVSMDSVAALIGSAVARAHDTPGLKSTSTPTQDGSQGSLANAQGVSRGIMSRVPGSTEPRPYGIRTNGTTILANGNGTATLANGNGNGTIARANVNGMFAHANGNGSGTVARANATRTSPRANSSEVLASSSALTSRTSLFDSEVPTYNGRSALSRGSSSTSPSAEMFMLKRRIPKALHSIVDRDSTAAVDPSPLPQANTTGSALSISSRQGKGGAYLRLDTDNYTGPSRTATVSDTSTVLSEAKSKQATAPASPEVTLCASQADAAKTKQPRFAVAASKSGLYPLFVSDTDTQRHRDHYGRALVPATSAMAGMYARLALGSALLVAALLYSGISPSLLLLVLACPQADGSKRSHASMLPIVQCSVENSAWLSGLRSSARGLFGTCPKPDKATSLWYARCDGWRMYQEERQDASSSGSAAVGRCLLVEVA